MPSIRKVYATGRGFKINVLRIIDEIEHVVETGKGVMGKKVINEEEFYAKIQSLRSALPKSMKEAEELMRRGEAIVKSAETEASRLIDTAEREAEKIVTDARTKADRTVTEAKNHADRVTTEAQNRADRVISDADAYSERTRDNSEKQAQRTIDEANDRAAHIEADAQKRADDLVAENSITVRAQEEAEQTLANAQRDSDEMRRQADDYAFEVLNKITGVLDKLTHSVDMGKESLRQNSASFQDDSYGEPYIAGANEINGFRSN